MLFAHPLSASAMRRVAASLHLDDLSRRVDLRLAYDVVVVLAALLVGALLWLALAQPMPAKWNRLIATKNCSSFEREGTPYAALPSH
ncbi:MAG TPA: hypothetical protein VMU18_11290 [Rhodoblastus sp.]|nr:hypothetical protein [Rhodoblastus sp.]